MKRSACGTHKARIIERNCALLQLPTDLVLYCLKFAVSDEKDALAASRSCRFIQQIIYETPRLFLGYELVTIRPAVAKVHPFWRRLQCDDLSSEIASLRLFRSTVESLILYNEPVGCYSSHLVEVGNFPVLSQLVIHAECNNVHLALALHCNFNRLTNLHLPATTICSYIAPALPVQLEHLHAYCISPIGAESLCVLPKLKSLTLKLCSASQYTLSGKVPFLKRYEISRFDEDSAWTSTASELHQIQVFDFTPFQCLTDLTVYDHARLKLPGSLTQLNTYQSNLLIGEIPELKVVRMKQYKLGAARIPRTIKPALFIAKS
jgi:hypothetical protein